MPARRPSTLKVLFIGNSFTARNDVPALIAALAAARGKCLEHRLISAGGASLRRHWNKGEAQEAIRRGKHDFVVLQEQSTLPIKNASRMHESVRLFHEVIAPSGAKTALYMTWARAHAPESQRAITDAYTSITREIDATLVPVGIAWEHFLRKHGSPVLHDRDGSHPTIAGSYLAACVFFGALFDESPNGADLEVEGIDAGAAAELRQAAARALKDS